MTQLRPVYSDDTLPAPSAEEAAEDCVTQGRGIPVSLLGKNEIKQVSRGKLTGVFMPFQARIALNT
ncbi:MAG: hypothetical protein QOI53_4022 [Verrucomicrobiota bacterium]|jgi:hypothetical protein|nr:hypothetical protein [Verrucomicrobiota bacterium]